MRSRPISAASPSSYRRMPATARRQISRRWRAATSMPMWRRAGPETPLPAQPCHRRSRPTNRRASKPCAQRSRPAATQAPTGCASNCPSLCSGRSNIGFRQYLLRGFEKVRAEWAIISTVHNLLKLALVAGPEAEFVRCVAAGPCSTLTDLQRAWQSHVTPRQPRLRLPSAIIWTGS